MKTAINLILFLCSVGHCQQSISLCENNKLGLNVDYIGDTCYWEFNGNNYSLTEFVPIDLSDTGVNVIQIIVANNYGCYDFEKKTVKINACEILYLPNAFTPNNDNLNDTLKPVGSVKDYQMEVYDRWGNLIHNAPYGWPGNGVIDIYTVKLYYKENKQPKIITSRVQLLL